MSVAAEYGADRAVLNALGNACDDFLGGEFLAHNELVEQLLACFGNGFLDRLAQAFKTRAHIGKRCGLCGAVLAVLVSLVVKEVDVGVCLTVNDIGNNHRAHRRSEGGFQVFKYAVEARVLVAQAVDEENLCQARLGCGFNSLFGSDVNAVLAGNNDQRCVGSAHTLGNAAGKVKQTGGVDEVDFCSFPFYRRNGGHN